MKDQLIKKLQALQSELDAIKDNRATWKAARKLSAAVDILERDWPREETKPVVNRNS